jgi:hypothetical protein
MTDHIFERLIRLETQMEERFRGAEAFRIQTQASLATLHADLDRLALRIRSNGRNHRVSNATWAGGGGSFIAGVAALGKLFGAW